MGPTITLEISGTAIAYRFDWYQDRSSTYVPATEIKVGFVARVGVSRLANSPLGVLRTFELVALYADGRERRLGSSQLRIGEPLRLPRELVSK